jgi:predicted RNA-binding protein with PUA-like domain
MGLLILIMVVLVLVAIFWFLKPVKWGSSNVDQKFWLFYAGPENYLYENGERDYQGGILWSCEPGTRKGDLILLYRKSINNLTVDTLIRRFKMTKEVAQDIKKRGVGKDISALWRAVSDGKRQLLWGWPYGCYVRKIQKLDPPVSLEELKAVPELKRWKSLRWNFRATGRSALEIPPFAWKILLKIIERKCGVKIDEQGSTTA